MRGRVADREITLPPGRQVAVAVRCAGNIEDIMLAVAAGPTFDRPAVIGMDRWQTPGGTLAWTWIGDVLDRPGLTVRMWAVAGGRAASNPVVLRIGR